MKLVANRKEIKKAMLDFDLKHQDLADELNINSSYLSRILNSYVPEKVADNIVELFGGDITDYFKAEFSSNEIKLHAQSVKQEAKAKRKKQLI